MRIGFLLPAVFAVGNRGSGIAEQARRQGEALESLGHTVIRLNPWEWQDERELDVLQFYLGGPTMAGVVEHRNLSKPGVLVFAPIIDSNEPFLAYRMAAALGSFSSRLSTVPGYLRRQALASDAVICRSSHERQRVIRGLGVPSERTAIVLNGCPPHTAPSPDLAAARQKLGLPEEFVLHISAYTQERKNVLRLIEATERLGYPLVLAGTAKWGPVMSEIDRRAQGNQRLRVLGFVDEATKAALYGLCRVFCLPSVHEGTGLAALEAASAGANVVITRNGGAPDYFLEHAQYVDPQSVASIQAGLLKAWHATNNGRLRNHIQTLSWSQSGKSLERLYSRLLEGKSPRPAQGPGARPVSGTDVDQRADFA